MTTTHKQALLKELFLKSAFVKDAAKGYVVVKNFNLAIDPDILQLASRCWAEYVDKKPIDALIGLPDAGARLVSVLADMLRVPQILPTKRAIQPPGAWEDVISYTNASFTMAQDGVKSHLGFVKAGMKVLLVDDVVAYGETATAAISALQAIGVEVVGLAVLFDKQWQGGVERITSTTGVPVHSLISIEKIMPDGTIVVANQTKA